MNAKRMKITLLILFSLLIFFCPAASAETSADTGKVCGTVKVWKTRVKTVGATSAKEILLFLEDKNGRQFSVSDERITMDQRGLVFIPHVLPIRKGTTVTFLNNDQVDHNVYFLFEETGETLDIGTWGYGISKDHRFTQNGLVIVLCKLHLEMAAYIVVLDNPYYSMAVVDGGYQQAAYCIDNVPPGEYTLKAWHKKLKMKGGHAQISVKNGQKTTCDVVLTKAKYAK